MLKDNPAYTPVFTSTVHNVTFYQPKDVNKYHVSRYIAAGAQNIYASCGTTKEYMDAITSNMLDIINTGNAKRIISDMAVLVNNLRYRLKHPVDEDCALRIGAIYSIMETENPDEVNGMVTTEKIKMCRTDAALYEFFFHLGLVSVPAWQGQLNSLEEMPAYLTKRNEALMSLSLSPPE